MPIINLDITEDEQVLPIALQDLSMNRAEFLTNPHILGILLLNLRVNKICLLNVKGILIGNLKLPIKFFSFHLYNSKVSFSQQAF